MKRENKNKQSGIALIITIVLISIMLTSVILVSKEMVDEVRNSTRIDNSLIAYYAAEAGLEDALLEWRYNRDTEIPTRTVNINSDTIVPNNSKKDYTRSYYELNMTNRVNSIDEQVILKDNVFEFSIPSMNQDVNLNWSFNPNTSPNQYRIEITTYDGFGNIVDAGKFFTNPGVSTQTIPNSIIPSGEKAIFRVRPWYLIDPPAGVIPSINLNINSNSPISGSFTNIESVGYYGGVARKINARIDRTSGSIISINDFVIYSASDLIK
uniref:Type 4 fimbrial biogenesis protein PilX N-terminal domain-containing protein n=1 Tax=candidate division CPR3 bacterium TaxID=2268181 RepID=A0A7C4R5Q5_UNCC3